MRILVVSDIHANFAALEAVLNDAGRVDKVWCLGDVVGYGPDPDECIERLRAYDLVCLGGNHDFAAVGKLDVEDFSSDAQKAIVWTQRQLSPANRAWLETLSPAIILAEYGVTLVHGSPRDPLWEYVSMPDVARQCLTKMETQIGLFGHTHMPIIFRKPTFLTGISTEFPVVNEPLALNLDRMLINPGSVGQPRDDDPRAAYAIVDLDAMTLTHHRVLYDVSATQGKMKQAKLPGGLVRRLRFGQ